MKPLNAFPGPSSMNRVKPCASKYRMDSSQRTDDVTCSTNRRRTSAASPCGCAVTFEITGTDGTRNVTAASAPSSFDCALDINAE